MVNVLSQTESAFMKAPAFNIQLSKTAHQPFPGEEQAEADFILVNATTGMANEYSRQGKSQTRTLAAENKNRILERQDLSQF